MKSILFGILLLIITLTSLNASEQTPEGEAEPLSPASVERFFDKQIQPAIDKQEIIGAIVAIVQGDKPLLIKGYGITDITDINPKPVDPGQTLFRTASVTKIFVSMAAMQMIEEGKLHLDGDVNDYLKSFQAPTIGNQPLTIRNLLSHQGGYDSDISNIISTDHYKITTTPEQVRNGLIPINPPGKYAVYDNYGLGLLALVLAEVDGKPFSRVINDRILSPLGMDHSVIGVPKNRIKDVQSCHELVDDKWQSCGILLMLESIQGAGSLSITASDMARFLSALLNQTRHANGRILSKDSFAEYINMDLNRNHPLLSGLGRLTLEIPPVGGGIFGHAGHVPSFVSNLMVSPADNIAAYISVNGHSPWNDHLLDWLQGKSEKQQQATMASSNIAFASWNFLKQHSPIAAGKARTLDYPGVEQLTPFTDAEIQQFSGRYISMRDRTTSHLSVLVLNSLKGGIEVDVASDGSFSIDNNGTYVQQVPRLFIDNESGRKWTFLTTDLGLIIAGGLGSEHLKLAWHEQAWVNIWPGVIVSLLLLIAGIWLSVKAQNTTEKRYAFSAITAISLLVIGILLEVNYGRFLIMDEMLTYLSHIWRAGLGVISVVFFVLAITGYTLTQSTNRSIILLISTCSIFVASWQLYWNMAL